MFEFPPGSPNSGRRAKDKSMSSSASKIRYVHAHIQQLVDLTIFHIPGLDVKVHYESKTVGEVEENYSNNAIGNRRFLGKKAFLYAWMTLQSIPEETIISPHILEFLEQTLEPLPTSLQHQTKSTGIYFFLINTLNNFTTYLKIV